MSDKSRIIDVCNDYFGFSSLENTSARVLTNKDKTKAVLFSTPKQRAPGGNYWLYFNNKNIEAYVKTPTKYFFVFKFADVYLIIDKKIKESLAKYLYLVNKKEKIEDLCISITDENEFIVYDRPPASPSNCPPTKKVGEFFCEEKYCATGTVYYVTRFKDFFSS